MLLELLFPISRAPCITGFSFIYSHSFHPRRFCSATPMGSESLSLIQKSNPAISRLINVSGFKTELLEIRSQHPKLHVLFIPGNPGVISFYTGFLEFLYDFLGGTSSVTGIGHVSHSEKDWESGRLFSLQEQISHKLSFIEQEFEDDEVPIVLVGHSIGSYISLEVFRRFHKKAIYCIGLYPFLALNMESSAQSSVRKITALPALCTALISFMGALLGKLPARISRFLVKKSMGKSWSFSAVEVLCTHVLQYHTIRNMLFMGLTEFQELQENLDLDFIRGNKDHIAFLFGLDDYWGPLHQCEEIRKHIPDLSIEVEREGHTHAFSCSDTGSLWVAQHVSNLIKKNVNLSG